MIVPLAYWSFVFLTLAISWRAGSSDDRRIVTAIILASLVTVLLDLQVVDIWQTVAVLSIDLALFFVVTEYALRGCRLWPVWFAAFQLATIFTDVAAILFAESNFWLFGMLAGFWAIPALLVMTIGIVKDAKAEQAGSAA